MSLIYLIFLLSISSALHDIKRLDKYGSIIITLNELYGRYYMDLNDFKSDEIMYFKITINNGKLNAKYFSYTFSNTLTEKEELSDKVNAYKEENGDKIPGADMYKEQTHYYKLERKNNFKYFIFTYPGFTFSNNGKMIIQNTDSSAKLNINIISLFIIFCFIFI